MRAALTIVVTCAALVACSGASGGSTDETSLRVAFWEDGTRAKPDEVWTLRCNPADGSLRRPALACRRLAAGGIRLFAPISANVACTEIYGGPQRARVTGVLDGKRVWASFSRTNGCHIARWARISPWLVPPGGAT